MATCKRCGCTIFWDCECDPEINALMAEAEKQEQQREADYERLRDHLPDN